LTTLNFWVAADEKDNVVLLSNDTNAPMLLKVNAKTLNDLLGTKLYDTFPRYFTDSNGKRIVSLESNVVLSPDYVCTGCSVKRNYEIKNKPNFKCASTCE
jgi:hypothetical protein